jgi:putative ABC transport system permease protein
MSWGFFWRSLWRESRGARGRLLFFAACVAVGVSAVVGVAALSDAVELGIRGRSRELLGGDLAIESRTDLGDTSRFFSPQLLAAKPQRLEMRVLSTMVRSPRGTSQLAELKAVDLGQSPYPLAGELELEPSRPLSELLDDKSVLIAPALMQAQKLHVGDSLFIGGQAFRVAGTVVREPDPVTFSFSFGPRVLMTRPALERTGLLGLGQRVRFRTLLRFAPDTREATLKELKHELETRIPGGGTYVRVETHADAQPALRETLERVERYLGLVALLSLLVASVGVAQIVSTWLAQATPQTAIMRCLGLRPREIMALYLGHVLLLALLGSLVGSALGAALPALIAFVRPELVPSPIELAIPWAAIARGQLLGVGVALVFSLPPLTAVWKVSPALVLRAEIAPLPVPRALRLTAAACLLIGVFGAAYAQTGKLPLAAAFAGGVSMLGVLLWLGARALLWAIGKLPRERMPALLWQGAAALARPGAGATGSIVVLGMGALVVLGLSLVQGVLAREIVDALPADAPSVFMMDIQTDQWPGVERSLKQAGASNVQSVPVIIARLRAVDGRAVEALVQERAAGLSDQDRQRWVLTREQRMTSYAKLPDSNQLVAGELWHDPAPNEVSVEVDFARDMGAHLGSTLTFDVQGVPMDFRVTSLRSVQWRSFAINFFLVVEPGYLDDAPQFRFAGARLAPDKEQSFQDELASTYPNVSVLRVHQLIERAAALFEQAALAVRLLGGFAILTGLIVLTGAVAASQLRRAREAALLKVLGLTRIRVVAMFATEYALLGTVSGLIAVCGSYLLTALFTRGVLELDTPPSLAICALGFFGTIIFSLVAGLLASLRALNVPPLDVFRR